MLATRAVARPNQFIIDKLCFLTYLLDNTCFAFCLTVLRHWTLFVASIPILVQTNAKDSLCLVPTWSIVPMAPPRKPEASRNPPGAQEEEGEEEERGEEEEGESEGRGGGGEGGRGEGGKEGRQIVTNGVQHLGAAWFKGGKARR